MTTQRANQLVEAGVWLQATGDREGARRLFEQALKLDPTNAQAQQFLGGGTPSAVSASAALWQGVSLNPFERPSALEALRDLEFQSPAPAPRAQGPLPYDVPAEVAPPSPSVKRSGILQLDNVVSPGPASPPPPPPANAADEVRTLLRGAEDLIDLDDHSGALDLLHKALELEPKNADAERLRQKAEQTLLAMYESKIGRLDARPQILLKQDEIIWLNLDHRAGFVLAQIDGQVTYDDLFAICGMTRLDTARILAQLLDERVIAT